MGRPTTFNDSEREFKIVRKLHLVHTSIHLWRTAVSSNFKFQSQNAGLVHRHQPPKQHETIGYKKLFKIVKVQSRLD